MTEQDCQEEIDGFYNRVNNLGNFYYLDHIIGKIYYYHIPKELEYEIITLYYLYGYRDFWASHISTVDNRIKRKVKEISIKSMVNKIDKNPDIYFKLKKLLDERPRFSDSDSVDYIRTSIKKYIWFSLHKVIKETPDYIKVSIDFNL